MAIYSQKTVYNVTIIDWNRKNYEGFHLGPIPALYLNSFLRYKQNKVNCSPKNGKNDHLDAKKLLITCQLMIGIGKIIRGLKSLDKEVSFGTNPSSVAQFVHEIQAKQGEF